MTHTKNKNTTRVKKIRNYSKGYRVSKGNIRSILEKKDKALQHATTHLKQKKIKFRSLWIQRINAGVREHGLNYSSFINNLSKLNININRKILSELSIYEPYSFKSLIDQAKQV